jgi:uncharacterized membrane protein
MSPNIKRDIPLGILYLVISCYCLFSIAQYLNILHEPLKIGMMVLAINVYNFLFNVSLKKIFPIGSKKEES